MRTQFQQQLALAERLARLDIWRENQITVSVDQFKKNSINLDQVTSRLGEIQRGYETNKNSIALEMRKLAPTPKPEYFKVKGIMCVMEPDGETQLGDPQSKVHVVGRYSSVGAICATSCARETMEKIIAGLGDDQYMWIMEAQWDDSHP